MRRAAAVAAALGLLAVWAWAFAPALAGGDLFVRDTFRHFVPHKAAIAAAWRAGRLPLWNPAAFGGMPRLAVPAAGAWHPMNLLFLLPLDPGRAATFFILLQYPIAFAGMLLFARRAGLGGGGALAAATAYALSGFHLVAHINPHPLTAVAVLPWLLAAAWRADIRSAGAAALALAALAAGGEAVVGWLATLLAAAAFASDSDAPPRRRAACVAAALALGVAASAAVWLPAAAITPETDRAAGLSAGLSAYYSVAPAELFELFLPYSYLDASGRNPVGAIVFPYGAPLYFVLYLGAAAWFLAFLGLRGPRRPAAFGAAALAAGVLLALGAVTPLHGLLHAAIPPLRAFRFPVKYLHVAAFGLSLLAGLGADRAAAASPRERRVVAAGLGGAYLLLGAVLLLPGRLPWSYVRETFAPAWWHAAIALAAAWVLTARRAPAVALILLVAADGAIAGRPHARTVPAGFYATAPAAAAQVRGGRLLVPGDPPPAFHLDGVPGDFEAAYAGWAKELLFPQAGEIWGLSYWEGYEGFYARRYLDLRAAIEAAPSGAHARLLGAFGVGAFVVPRAVPEVVPNPFLLSRAQAPPRVRYVESDAEALALVRAGHAIWEEALLLDPPRAGETEAFAGAAEARLVRDDPEAVDVEVAADSPRVLVLADADWPSWEAAVDGRPARILRANAYVRSVEVPAGRHTVAFRYRPRGVGLGIAVSIAGLAAGTLLALWPSASGTSPSSPTSTMESPRSPTASSSGPGRSRCGRCGRRSSTRWTSSGSAGSRSSRTRSASATSGRRESTSST